MTKIPTIMKIVMDKYGGDLDQLTGEQIPSELPEIEEKKRGRRRPKKRKPKRPHRKNKKARK